MQDEKEIFCELIKENEKDMYYLALSILRNEHDASDAIQDAILKAYCNMESLRNKKHFKSWIMSIVHNTAIEYIRKHKDTVDIDDLDEPDCNEGTDTVTKMALWDAVNKLRLPYRTIVILFYYQGMSVRQISNIMKSSAPAVRKQLSRAREMLATLLDKEDFV